MCTRTVGEKKKCASHSIMFLYYLEEIGLDDCLEVKETFLYVGRWYICAPTSLCVNEINRAALTQTLN